MRCRLLFALTAWAALGLLNVSAREPNRLPTVADNEVVSDDAMPADGATHAISANAGIGHAGAPYGPGEAQFNGYPFSGAWHAGYMHPMFGAPVALVVPPNSHYQVNYGWGIGATQVYPVYPQFDGPGYGTPYAGGGLYNYPPYWPWDTRQFGVYYIRGPW